MSGVVVIEVSKIPEFKVSGSKNGMLVSDEWIEKSGYSLVDDQQNHIGCRCDICMMISMEGCG